ncbi:MAG: hypothetical protein KAI61_02905 [Alphaproteobacteria bacterium]|nr:hypothetical protein [Alphaproteobacteria bacterium]MCK5518339.1 hypothetical protein [Alphaproteobacteria bacterium]MCK5556093.1 hypothetical protein [Alphaproteobacteria bacterium]
MNIPNLNDILKPGEDLPADEVMVAKTFEILKYSPHGQQLVNFVKKKGINIKVIATARPVAYLPEKKLAYIGFNINNPLSSSRFILTLVGVLREAQQEAAGIKLPDLHAPMSEHTKIGVAKYQDKVWYMCTVAFELNDQLTFSEYKFLDELRKMGHNELLDLYIKQERS